MFLHTNLSPWADRRQVQSEKRTTCREWWRWRWNREAAAASESGRWYPGMACHRSRCSKPSVSSSCSPLTPTPPTPWNYWGLADHCPNRKEKKSSIFFFFLITSYETHWVDDNQPSIVGPGSQFHATVLHIKREMEDNNLTVALEDGWRVPNNLASVLKQDFSFMDDGKVAIGAAEKWSSEGCDSCTGMHVCVSEGIFTCCKAPDLVSRSQMMALWFSWCLRNRLGSSWGLRLPIAAVETSKYIKNDCVWQKTRLFFFCFFLNCIFVVYLPQTYITGHNLADLILKRQQQIKQVRNMVESVDLCAF